MRLSLPAISPANALHRTFAIRRIDILSSLLSSGVIYHTPEVRALLEPTARQNMERELKYLEYHVALYTGERRWSIVKTPTSSKAVGASSVHNMWPT